jgi:hypothetical protein
MAGYSSRELCKRRPGDPWPRRMCGYPAEGTGTLRRERWMMD